MERRGLIIAAIVAVALALVLWLVLRGDGDADRVARIGTREGSARAEGGGSHRASAEGAREQGASGESQRSGANRRDAVDDGGVRRALLPTRPAPTQRIEGPSGRTAPPRDVPRETADHSAGWRLGEARRRMEIVEPRIAHMERIVRDFEQRGDTANAERQRAVLQRFELRRTELREDLAELETQARRDGTLGEADQGYADTESEALRAPGRETPSGAIERAPSPAR